MDHALLSHFENLPDPRVERTKKYPLLEIIFLVISGVICGCEGWKQIKDFGEMKLSWLRQFLPYKEGIPVDDTIARVMRKLNTRAFQACFIHWMRAISEATNGDIIAIDGKTLRGSSDNTAGKAAIHMVSAWSTQNSVVLGQEKTHEKSNEITAIPELLNALDIKGCTVTIDAMGCQKEIAEKIIKQKGDYVLALKGNQGCLHYEVTEHFAKVLAGEIQNKDFDYHEENDIGHGRIEHRQCWGLTPSIINIPSYKQWVGLKSVVMVKSRREMKNETTEDTRFYITSFEKDAEKSLAAVRRHWGIENSLHWTLDVSFREDESRIRKDSGPENLAIVRHIALNLLRSDTSIQASVKRKKFLAALNDDVRERIIRQII